MDLHHGLDPSGLVPLVLVEPGCWCTVWWTSLEDSCICGSIVLGSHFSAGDFEDLRRPSDFPQERRINARLVGFICTLVERCRLGQVVADDLPFAAGSQETAVITETVLPMPVGHERAFRGVLPVPTTRGFSRKAPLRRARLATHASRSHWPACPAIHGAAQVRQTSGLCLATARSCCYLVRDNISRVRDLVLQSNPWLLSKDDNKAKHVQWLHERHQD